MDPTPAVTTRADALHLHQAMLLLGSGLGCSWDCGRHHESLFEHERHPPGSMPRLPQEWPLCVSATHPQGLSLRTPKGMQADSVHDPYLSTLIKGALHECNIEREQTASMANSDFGSALSQFCSGIGCTSARLHEQTCNLKPLQPLFPGFQARLLCVGCLLMHT